MIKKGPEASLERLEMAHALPGLFQDAKLSLGPRFPLASLYKGRNKGNTLLFLWAKSPPFS